MFYNRNAAVLKRALAGEFAAALAGERHGFPPRGWGEGAVPLAIFHDHLPDAVRTGEWLQDLLPLEMALRTHEPFASLAQHIHLVCARPHR